jgi:hypothetical protein
MSTDAKRSMEDADPVVEAQSWIRVKRTFLLDDGPRPAPGEEWKGRAGEVDTILASPQRWAKSAEASDPRWQPMPVCGWIFAQKFIK